MASELIDSLREFLVNANLSTYCINAYLILVNSDDLTAKEITQLSSVPIGRIYEVLDELEKKGMIEIHHSRPKKFTALPLNRAIYNLITHQTRESKRKSKYLFEQAKLLEAKLYNSDLWSRIESSKIFYSTVLGSKTILALYIQYIDESQEELLINEFINESTLKVLSLAKTYFETIHKALDRGVQVKMLWSFEYDERPLSEEQKMKNNSLFSKIKAKHEEFGLLTEREGFDMKFIYRRIPTYYDIFDKKRVMIKLQNPLNPWQVYASLNIVDPILAEELRKIYYNVWIFEANEEVH